MIKIHQVCPLTWLGNGFLLFCLYFCIFSRLHIHDWSGNRYFAVHHTAVCHTYIYTYSLNWCNRDRLWFQQLFSIIIPQQQFVVDQPNDIIPSLQDAECLCQLTFSSWRCCCLWWSIWICMKVYNCSAIIPARESRGPAPPAEEQTISYWCKWWGPWSAEHPLTSGWQSLPLWRCGVLRYL